MVTSRQRDQGNVTMGTGLLEHKFAAILYGDVAGHRRLTWKGKEETHRVSMLVGHHV